MLSGRQGEVVVELVRKKGRILRGDRLQALRLVNSLVNAVEEQVPEMFLLPFSSCLAKILSESRFDRAALPPAVGSMVNKNHRLSTVNLRALAAFGARIHSEFGAVTEDAVLAGDAAALAGLYQDPGAFIGSVWTALLQDGTCANGNQHKMLKPLAKEWSERIQLGDAVWRKPKPALMISLFAGHVGDPAAAPTPPMWSHLGLALILWKDRIKTEEILRLGSELGQREEVERGLAIAAHIFPELEKWINPEKLSIPAWERKFAIPIAARRLIQGERQ